MINKRLIKIVPGAKRYIIGNVAFQWLGLVANIALMFAIGWYFEALFNHTITQTSTTILLLSVLGAIIMRVISMRGAQDMSAKSAAIAKHDIRKAVYDKLVDLGPSYTEDVSSYEAVNLAIEGTEQLEVFFGGFLPQLLYALIAPVTLFIFLLPFNFFAALVPFLCVPLIPASIMMVQKIAKKTVKEYWGTYTDLGGRFLDNLQGLTTLKIYQADKLRHEQMNKEAENFRQATMKVLVIQLNSITVMDVIAFGGSALTIITVIMQALAGNLAFGFAIAFIMLSAEFFIPMRTLGSLFHAAMNGMAASDHIFALLDIPSSEKGTESLDNKALSIAVEHIDYSYDGKRQVLDDVSVEFPVGLTAIVGASGSGKSTLAGVISGRNKKYQGDVLIGKQNLQSIKRSDYMRALTTVSHDSYLFKGSVKENLLVACPDAHDEQLMEALDKCRLGDFVRLHGGLDMPLQEGASNLSGGQRQRLNLARALLHDSSFYIFDEATSNIDPESEAAIYEVINELALTKVVIVVSHRLSAIAHAQNICVLKKGKLVEQGSHETLLEQNGAYASLWNQQAALEAYVDSHEATLAEEANQAHQHVLDTQVSKKAENKPSYESKTKRKTRSHMAVMGRLIGLVGPLMPFMILAITLGILGFLAAIFLTVEGSWALSMVFTKNLAPSAGIIALLLLLGISRGFLRYGEQLSNHYIAFKILAIIRDKVFGALRRLAPAKLEGRDKGNLIALLTSDIELLEVFYAHTISPVVIAFVVSLIMTIYIATLFPVGGIIALLAFITIGIFVPLFASRLQKDNGKKLRAYVGSLNSFVLESLRGLIESLQYGIEYKREEELLKSTNESSAINVQLKKSAGISRALAYAMVFVFDIVMILASAHAASMGSITPTAALIVSVALMSSFGPVLAVAELGSTLQVTIASGNRVLDILDEQPKVVENIEGASPEFNGVELNAVSFSYDNAEVLKDVNFSVPLHSVVNIAGESGAGKSTLLKLIMRFWDVDSGSITINNVDLRDIKTQHLRNTQSYMTQDTHLFTGTIKENIALVKPDATDDEIYKACEKAALGELLKELPEGLNTPLGELESVLSGGERQRMGLARVFLHDAPLILLDEPTSNLDALSEASVLNALQKEREGKTILLVSHRKSTGALADLVYAIK